MYIRNLFLLIFLSFFTLNSFSISTVSDTSKINKTRIYIVSGSLISSVTASYFYIEKVWWSEQSRDFHFDKGNDMVYAQNVDKAGHFMGGLLASETFSSSFLWAGLSEEKSVWYGALYGSSLQLAIEIKDAYAPHWGFSKWDLIIGSSGSFLPVLKYYYKSANAFDVKMSYYPHSNIYWELENQRGNCPSKFDWHDDYPNQTYWISADVNHFIQQDWWPDFLNIAVGFGIDDTQYLTQGNTKLGGENEFYIALDYNIPKLLKNWNSPRGKKVKKWLNFIKLPAPTIRISPTVEFYPFFM